MCKPSINVYDSTCAICTQIHFVQMNSDADLRRTMVSSRAGQIFEIFKCFKCFKKDLKNVSDPGNILNI